MSEDAMIELKTPPLPYYLGSGRSDFRAGDNHTNRKNLGLYDLLMVINGELHIGENNRQWTLTEGDTLLLLPDGEHYSIRPCDRDTSFYWVHFEHTVRRERLVQSESVRALFSSRPFINPYTLRLPKQSRLSNLQEAFGLMQQLLDLPDDSFFWEEQRLLAQLLAMLESGSSRTRSVADRLAEQTAAYIQKNYKEKITNETLSAALHFHPNYIVRCMKSKYGRTPIEYLHHFRLERAKRLLVTTEWSIERIADEVGFRYSPYFSACFKQSFGLSPLKFRRQYLN
ncbi:helix-turn-helix domain-containing protein [Paenibacillus arenilitoris]|uniref:AraC family transcriptional regulator n=1 Tax=Paenibacillus arenilitoris TaxID=2772299 RepID=A0A927H5U7_9BACL|nr:AraC family transcriptional regulator [Paenibacillus arenilitoris]MBD2868802.1 AraC family transcriptional regulator [Paenibacillus arenilitoris]